MSAIEDNLGPEWFDDVIQGLLSSFLETRAELLRTQVEINHLVCVLCLTVPDLSMLKGVTESEATPINYIRGELLPLGTAPGISSEAGWTVAHRTVTYSEA